MCIEMDIRLQSLVCGSLWPCRLVCEIGGDGNDGWGHGGNS